MKLSSLATVSSRGRAYSRDEFRSVELAYWLKQQKVYFALRLKQGSYIKLRGQEYQKLNELGLAPGMKLFFTGVKFTKKKGFGSFSVAAYWKRKYRGIATAKAVKT